MHPQSMDPNISLEGPHSLTRCKLVSFFLSFLPPSAAASITNVCYTVRLEKSLVDLVCCVASYNYAVATFARNNLTFASKIHAKDGKQIRRRKKVLFFLIRSRMLSTREGKTMARAITV